jgi:hypothetical protein
MPREISDEEYNFLQARRQIADFVEPIWNDPQLSTEAKALIKKKYPNMQIADYDLEQKVEQRFAERDRTEREAREEHQRQTDEKYWKEQRESVQKKYNFTDEGMQDLEKFMLEKNVGDYNVAAEYRAAKEPKASEPTYKDPYWHHERSDTFKEIAKDPEEWGRSEIMKALRNDQNRQNQF